MNLLKAAISGVGIRNNHAHVVDTLGKEIVGGVFPVGANLPCDADLEERFQVSRTVLREAMKTLSAKGLVVARARVGTRVTEQNNWNLFDRDILAWHFHNGVDQEFLDHLCDMRISFEPTAAMLAAKHAEKEHLERLYNAVDQMRFAESNEEFALADLEFHLAILDASRNPFMFSVGNIVEAALVSMFVMSSPAEDEIQRENVSDEHKLIADAIRDHDSETAKSGMYTVIETGRSRMNAST